MKISIIGLGWLGQVLASELSVEHEIFGTTRDCGKLEKFKSLYHVELLTHDLTPSDKLLNTDLVILNIPPFKELLSWLKKWNWDFKSKIIFLSSTSVYELNEGYVDELTLPQYASEKTHWLIEQENWIQSTFKSHVIIRLGGLIGEDRHPGKVLAGRKNIANGESPVNLIHQMDIVRFIQEIIRIEYTPKLYNLVFPSHPTRAEYYQNYARKFHLEEPTFITSDPKGKIVTDRNVLSIFEFKYPI